MSASLASAMMNARECGLALISASLVSREFMIEPRMDTNGHESEYDSLPFQSGVFEVQNHANSELSNLEVVQHLSSFDICDAVNHFGVHNHRVECDQVRNKQPHLVALVEDLEVRLLLERNLAKPKLYNQCVLIRLLVQPMPEFI